MQSKFSVSLQAIIKEMSLEVVYMPEDPETVLIKSTELCRPGLELTGYFEYYDNERILVFGHTEFSYLDTVENEERSKIIDDLFSRKAPAMVMCRSKNATPEMLEAAKKHKMPILKTSEQTSDFISGLVAYLNVVLAPRVTRHGVLVEVYGEGILLMGNSGVGKSETAIELVKRGHRLIADDAVDIKKISTRALVGSSPENIRHFIELRGVGIINARQIFGIGAVKVNQKIDLIVNMEIWDPEKIYDRMGLKEEYTDILGINVRTVTIPIKPGRNTAIIIEVAAMNNRQKKMGYHSAQDLMRNLGLSWDSEEDDVMAQHSESSDWYGFDEIM